MSTQDNYRGKLEHLYSALDFLEYGPKDELVVMADSAILSNIDLNKVLRSHLRSGKDITIVAKDGIANGSKQLDLALKLDDQGEIADMAVDYVADESYLASMDIFVLSKDLLMRQVREHVARSLYHMDRDFVLGQWQQSNLSVNVYVHDGIALYNDSVQEYFENSLTLINKDVRDHIFGGNHPVFTKVRDRVPSYYGESCRIDNCIVADGCVLEGQASNCVLFRQVTLCKSAQVENCIIMNDTVVGEGSQLKYVILDKDVTVRPGTQLVGTPSAPIIIKRGEMV